MTHKLFVFYSLLFFLSITAFSQETFSIYDDQGLFKAIHEEIEEHPENGIRKLDSIERYIQDKEKNAFDVMMHYYKGIAYRNLGNFEFLYDNFQKAEEIALAHNYETYIPEIHRELGDEYMDQDLYDKAKEHYDIAIKWYKKLGNRLGVITCTYDGFIENKQGKYEESNSILKGLLPTFKEAHPVYLDALSTIAENYLSLENVDSAFAYVNKMPLETVPDPNNFNYSLHKYHVSFLYYLGKENIDSARYYNNLFDKYRFDKEVTIYYFKNKIELAKATQNTEDLIAYTDSLDLAYKDRLDQVKKEDVFTSEKVIATQNSLQKAAQDNQQQLYLFILLTLVLLIIGVIIFFYLQKQRKIGEAQIETMKRELEMATKQLLENKDENRAVTSVENKIIEISEKFSLSDREADILHHILQGYKNSEIAEKLFISTNTVKYHIKNLYVKLDVSKRTEISSKIIFDK